MKIPPRQLRGLASPVLLLYLLPVVVLLGYFTYVLTSGGDQAVLILFIILTMVPLLFAAFFCTWRFRIDETGVTFLTLTGRKQLSWQEVRSVQVQRLANGLRMIRISTLASIPPLPHTRDMAQFVNEHTITISYTRVRLDVLRLHWTDHIPGSPPLDRLITYACTPCFFRTFQL
ncbi:MAG: hypothetical protein E7327_01570 [Clostridiales bacterium]|nr:hypothetical protein [Clostridiales bacterium]